MRQKLLAVLIICTILSWGCAPAYHPGFSIVVIKSWWNCGEATKIDGDGNVYSGGENCWGSQATGQSKNGKISAQQVEEVIAAVKKADAFALKDHYATTSGCCDLTTTTLSITLDGQSKRISDYAGCDEGNLLWPWDKVPDVPPPPGKLCELEHKVDAIVKSIEWDTVLANATNTTQPRP